VIFLFTAYTGEIMGGIAGALLFIIAIALIFYRNWKYEQELDSLLWKVNYKEIQIKEQKEQKEVVGVDEMSAKSNSKVSAYLSLPLLEKIFVFFTFVSYVSHIFMFFVYVLYFYHFLLLN